MRHKTWYLFLTLLIIAITVAGCGKSPEALVNEVINTATQWLSGDVTGEVGKTYATDWFEFTIHSIEEVGAYAGYSPVDGCTLYDVVITETNIFDTAIPMGTFDFYMDDASFEEYIWPIDPLDDTMMPEAFDLAPGETVRYHMVYEIPSDVTGLMLMYTEVDEEDNEGRTFTIHISRP